MFLGPSEKLLELFHGEKGGWLQMSGVTHGLPIWSVSHLFLSWMKQIASCENDSAHWRTSLPWSLFSVISEIVFSWVVISLYISLTIGHNEWVKDKNEK